MNFIKRAVLHTTRKFGKSLLMFFILLIISTLVLICLSIRSSTEMAELNVRQSLGGSYTINANGTDGQLTNEILDKISLINGVDRIDNAHSESYAEYKSVDGESLIVKSDEFVVEETKGFEHAGKLQSNIYSEKDDFFVNEGFELLEGRHITKDDTNVVLIHEDFSLRNGLNVGDKMILDLNSDMVEDPGYISTPVEVEIIGVFTNTKEQNTALSVSYTFYENIIFTDPLSFTQLFDSGRDIYYSKARVVVNDPATLDDIVDEMKTIDGVNWDKCNIVYHDIDYQNAKQPLDSLNSLVSFSIIIISIVSVALLVLVLTMWIRGRINETGVLMSMGFSKVNILLQHMTEIILVAIVAFALSFPASSLIAQQVGDTLLEQATEASGDNHMTGEENNSSGDEISDVSETNLTQIDVRISTVNFLSVYGIGIVIIILSVMVAVFPIMKMKPKEILSTLS